MTLTVCSLVIEHCATPPLSTCSTPEEKQEMFQLWKDNLAKIKQLENFQNIYLKLSGLVLPIVGLETTNPKTKQPKGDIKELVSKMRPFFETLLELFPPTQLMVGSDFPVDFVGAK